MSTNLDLGRTETIILLRGEDEEQLRELRAAADRADAKAAKTKNPDDRAAANQANVDHDDFAEGAQERGVRVVVRSVGRKTYRKLLSEHPPREGEERDKSFGANLDTLPEALVPACLASPTFETDEDRDAWLDRLSEGQFAQLAVVAWSLNTSVGANPKARLASQPAPS